MNTLCQELIVGLDNATAENIRLETVASKAMAKAAAAEAKIIFLEAKIHKFEDAFYRQEYMLGGSSLGLGEPQFQLHS